MKKRLINLIKSYHYEIKGCVDLIENLEKSEVNENENSFILRMISNLRFGCFVMSSFIDLLTTQKGIKRATSNWEYIYYSKIGYLINYETINTFHKHKKI